MTTRRLTLCYVLALAFVAILSLASHAVVVGTLWTSKGSAAVINLSGRQRMLSQRITAMALELERGDESARPLLTAAIGDFAETHRNLVKVATTTEVDFVSAARLEDAYFGAAQTDAYVEEFVRAAKRVALSHSRSAGGAAGGDDIDPADLNTLVQLSRGPLLKGLEQVVSIHQAESEALTARLEQAQWFILAAVLATLLAEGRFIFYPLIRQIGAHVRKLHLLAESDFLTGLPNRSALLSRASAEVERARRHRRALAVLMLDVDHFKHVNDAHGHAAGDAVLVALARVMTNSARREDVVARIGGEEFAVLLPETSASEGRVVAERIRAAVSETPIEVEGGPIKVSVSIGLASVPLDAADPVKAALQTADNMLYRAKNAGRNCVWPNLVSHIGAVA